MKYFVMLCMGTDDKHPVPMPMVEGSDDETDDWDDTVALYDTRKEAEAAGYQNAIGAARGYEVYEWPY